MTLVNQITSIFLESEINTPFNYAYKMGKERESSPNGKLQFQQHQETFKDKIKNDTEKNINLRPHEELPQLIDGLVQVQENVLAVS